MRKQITGEYGVPRFKVGDWIDAARWDKTERPTNRIGVTQVLDVTTEMVSESGVCIKVHKGGWMDQNWFVPADVSKGQFEI